MGQAMMGPNRPSWARPLRPPECPCGPCLDGPPQALMGHTLGGYSLEGYNLGGYNLGSYNLKTYILLAYALGGYSMGRYNLAGYSLGRCDLGGYKLGGYSSGWRQCKKPSKAKVAFLSEINRLKQLWPETQNVSGKLGRHVASSSRGSSSLRFLFLCHGATADSRTLIQRTRGMLKSLIITITS